MKVLSKRHCVQKLFDEKTTSNFRSFKQPFKCRGRGSRILFFGFFRGHIAKTSTQFGIQFVPQSTSKLELSRCKKAVTALKYARKRKLSMGSGERVIIFAHSATQRRSFSKLERTRLIILCFLTSKNWLNFYLFSESNSPHIFNVKMYAFQSLLDLFISNHH